MLLLYWHFDSFTFQSLWQPQRKRKKILCVHCGKNENWVTFKQKKNTSNKKCKLKYFLFQWWHFWISLHFRLSNKKCMRNFCVADFIFGHFFCHTSSQLRKKWNWIHNVYIQTQKAMCGFDNMRTIWNQKCWWFSSRDDDRWSIRLNWILISLLHYFWFSSFGNFDSSFKFSRMTTNYEWNISNRGE